MSHPAYNIRNYRPEDLDQLTRLVAEVEMMGQIWCQISLQDFGENLGQPNHCPENNLFMAEMRGDVIGCADVKPELDIGRVVLNFVVHPKHRSMGLAEKLIDRAIGRARELGARMVHVNIRREFRTARKVLNKMDFRFVRRFLELRLDLSETHVPEISQIAFCLRHLEGGEEDRLTQIQNRSFADTWGYHTNTVEEIMYRIHLLNCSPEDIILAWDADKPIGYCWTRMNFWKNKSKKEGVGRIYMLGVDPDHRGKGIGKQVLLAGLSYLKNKGLCVVGLTVDSKNKAACALYKLVGFKLWTNSLWYERIVS